MINFLKGTTQPPKTNYQKIITAAHPLKSIVILTGAGISAESGLATFRDAGGLWCGHRIEDVATPMAFERNPKLVHEFYNTRRNQLASVEPNTAHYALAKLAEEWHGNVYVITQNVDDLHDRALPNSPEKKEIHTPAHARRTEKSPMQDK